MILVTGHKGYIGSNLFKELKSKGHEVKGIDLLEGKDIIGCLPDEECEYVFHFAARPRVEFSVKYPSYTLRNNVFATSVLLEWAKDHGAKRFIFSSSSSVVGDGDGPTHPYGLHKLMSEEECRLYSALYGLDTVCLRYFNVYSEDQPFGGAYSTCISAWMEMLKSGQPLRLDGDGEQTRDMAYVSDVVSANILAMNAEERFDGRHYDVGTGESVSVNHIKGVVDKYHREKVKWMHAPARKGDVRHTKANIKGLQHYGWNPKVSIDEGLERCFKREL
jgi:nucleoside-diphosphate-sugar epimerase